VSGVLIVNAFATGVSEARVAAIVATLPRPLTTVYTAAKGDGVRLAHEAESHADTIYDFSGDGTYNEVLNGVTGKAVVGFLPGGGTSVLPRALGLPRDPVAAARQLARGRRRRIALGRANGRRFAFSCGVGLDAELVRRVDALGRSEDGKRPGDSAFVRAGLALARESRFRLEPALEVVGVGEAAFAFVANGSPYTYAGRLPLRFAPAATFEGGLDVFAPPSVSRLQLPLLAWWALGRGGAHVRLHDVAAVALRCHRALPLQLDGEDTGDTDLVVVEAEPDAVTVLV
jgi:diacylglycerol kinase family enzyme